MGIRSEVGVAVKKNVKFSEATQAMLENRSDDKLEDEEGTLYIFNDTKWYTDDDPELIQLYRELKENIEDCLVCEACNEFPSLDSVGNFGEWNDNPWDLGINISVSLSYS